MGVYKFKVNNWSEAKALFRKIYKLEGDTTYEADFYNGKPEMEITVRLKKIKLEQLKEIMTSVKGGDVMAESVLPKREFDVTAKLLRQAKSALKKNPSHF